MSQQIVIGAAVSVSFLALTGCGKSPGPSPPSPTNHTCADFSKDASTCNAQSSHGCSWDDGKKDVCAAAPGQADYIAQDQDTCQQWGGKLFHQCECVSQCPSKKLTPIEWADAIKNQQKNVGEINWLAADTKTNEPIKKETNGQRCSGTITSVTTNKAGQVVLNLQGGLGAHNYCQGQTLSEVTADQFKSLKILKDSDVQACSSAASCLVDNASSKCIESVGKEEDTCASHNAKFGSSSFSCPARCLKSCTSYCKPNDTKGKATDLSCANNKADTGCTVQVNGVVMNATDKICKLTKAADAKGGKCVGDYVNSTKIQ
jgi:hypothetical protein